MKSGIELIRTRRKVGWVQPRGQEAWRPQLCGFRLRGCMFFLGLPRSPCGDAEKERWAHSGLGLARQVQSNYNRTRWESEGHECVFNK